MNLRLGFSTCPNDTFIFDAMVHHKIDTEGLRFTPILADVEELNQQAFQHTIDITKISYHAYAHLATHYLLLDHGSALGNNNGPLLISKRRIYPDEVPGLDIAIPGKYTTANLLLSIAFPQATRKHERIFSEIEQSVLDGEVDAGLIIHENRFTYQQRGLQKIMDLGEYWEQGTGMPIPLGGIIVNRKLPRSVQLTVNRVLSRSIEYAFANPGDTLDFVRTHAQEMDTEVMFKHIDLYVNQYTRQLGEKGKEAIHLLFDLARKRKVVPALPESIFL